MIDRRTMIDRVHALRSVELFRGVPGRVLASVAEQADEVALAAGEVLMRRGDEGDEMFVVLSGNLAVDVGTSRLNELGAGSVVGELAVLAPQPRTATVTALEPTVLLRVRKAIMHELLLDHPEIAVGVIATLVHRFQVQSARVAGQE